MTADFLAWSHSRRKTFIDCPRQLYHTAVAKKGYPDHVPFFQSKAMLAGNEVDDALTARIGKGVSLPDKFQQFEPVAQLVLAAPGIKFTQMKVALDQTFKVCGYMDWDTTWVRAIYDLAIVNGSKAMILDWKNGQVWPDDSQLKLFAATGFHLWPEVDEIYTSYVWLRHNLTSDATYWRKELPDLWAALLPDVERMQASFKANHWPAEPKRGKATCKWCPVNRVGKCERAQGPYEGS